MNEPQHQARAALPEQQESGEPLTGEGRSCGRRYCSWPPAVMAVVMLLFKLQLPRVALLGFARMLGIALFSRIMRDAEWRLAIAIKYLRLSMMFVVPLAPVINGTNVMLTLLLFT